METPRDPKTYRAWLVDLDGTLYHQAAVRLVVGVELALRGWRAMPALYAFRAEQERQRLEVTEALADSFELQIERTALRTSRADAEIRETVQHWMIARPCRWLHLLRRRRLLQEIAAFRRQGGRTAVVSDYPARAKLRAMRIEHLFDVVVAPGESAAPFRLKPWPDGFLRAAGQLSIKACECLVVGDRLDADGLAAHRAGMAFRRV